MAKKKTPEQSEPNAQVIKQETIDKWNATDQSSITYTSEQFQQWVKDGKIPPDLGKVGLQEMEDALKFRKKREEFYKKNPTEEEILNFENSHIEQKVIKNSLALYNFVLSNKEALLKIIDGTTKKKKYRQSAHYVEQTLKYEKPTSKQLNIFDVLSPETREKVKDETVHYIGIRLSPEETKLVHSITRLLARNSQVTDYKANDFYMGNEETRIVPYGNTGIKEKSAVLRFKKHELLVEFFSNTRYSGADIKYFDRIFDSFKDKKWLTRYKRTVQEGKEDKHYIAEDYLPLVRVLRYFQNLSSEEAIKVENNDQEYNQSAGEYIISLHPILTDQIDQKYVEFPVDIDRRTRIASGSHLSVSEAVLLLRDWLITEMSAGRYETDINEENLIFKLRLDKHLKSRKKDRLEDQLAKAIQVSRHLGIILDVEKVTGAAGQMKYIFKLNKEFE